MIPFPNHSCNDSKKDFILLKSFRILEIVIFFICLILSLYFLLASFSGEFGVSKKYHLLAKEKILAKKLRETISERKKLSNKIQRLSDNALDLELLDQQARKILGLIGEEELIVY